MQGTAILLTQGLLHTPSAKTAHGLIRGSERFQVKAVIDSVSAGKDAGEVLDGKYRGIPVFGSIASFLQSGMGSAHFSILGVAHAGGAIAPEWMHSIRESIVAGMSVVSGMHQFLSENPEMVSLAAAYQVELIDVRKPKSRDELHFWSGEIHSVTCGKIAVLGTDCAVGKRTTARFLVQACRADGLKSEMIYTGQTGWMQGGKYGFVFDTTVNDFVSGEIEHAIVSCFREENPDVVFIEGQAALRNPSGPCGSEFLVSGMSDGVILVHPPGRIFYKGWEKTGRKIFPLANEIDLIKMYGVETLGIALNTQNLSLSDAKDWQKRFEDELSLPVVLPVEEGVEGLIPAVKQKLSELKR
ncbi:MAG: DUF1611 domain-containing protein [Bacteroidia bacterium]|nr:DUF1611 domain-containing protein [Bacteroidia bacterium]